MGARGPTPTPTGILKLRGSWRADEREGEPTAPEGRPDKPPSFSGKNGEHRKLWSKLMRLLESMPGVLSKVDGYQLERYCRFFIRWRQIEADIEKLTPRGVMATLISEPKKYDPEKLYKALSRESRNLDIALKQIEREFGLTPSARARLGCLRNGALHAVQKDDVEATYFGSEVG